MDETQLIVTRISGYSERIYIYKIEDILNAGVEDFDILQKRAVCLKHPDDRDETNMRYRGFGLNHMAMTKNYTLADFGSSFGVLHLFANETGAVLGTVPEHKSEISDSAGNTEYRKVTQLLRDLSLSRDHIFNANSF